MKSYFSELPCAGAGIVAAIVLAACNSSDREPASRESISATDGSALPAADIVSAGANSGTPVSTSLVRTTWFLTPWTSIYAYRLHGTVTAVDFTANRLTVSGQAVAYDERLMAG